MGVVDESPRDSFASALGTTSMSIPNISCFSPTVPSQAACGGAVTGFYVREFDMDRESGSWSASGSAFGSETGSGSETHSASNGCVHSHGHTQTTRNQRERAVDRILSLPPLAGCPQTPPALQRTWMSHPHRTIYAILLVLHPPPLRLFLLLHFHRG